MSKRLSNKSNHDFQDTVRVNGHSNSRFVNGGGTEVRILIWNKKNFLYKPRCVRGGCAFSQQSS